jgi:hypothetical protein
MTLRRDMVVILAAALTQAACGGGGASSSGPEPNAAPVIGGTPPAIAKVGTAYSFTPTASDPDGDQLTFAVSGKPDWADFDVATGKVSGVPTAGALGTVDNVRISVSDGSLSSDLQFSVTVASPDSATLTWSKPTRNVDGSPLTNLAGYNVYYGPTTGLGIRLDIGSGAITSTVIEGLSPGVWYFSMTAVNASGAESERTELVSVEL